MERRILFNNADDFEREVFRSEFDGLFDANSIEEGVNKWRIEYGNCHFYEKISFLIY